MGKPLFTEAELAEYESRRKKALEPLPGDKIYRQDSPRPYNLSAYERTRSVDRALEVETLKRYASRPEDIVNGLLVGFHEKGKNPISFDDIFVNGLGDRLNAADTPETRRHIHTILQGLRQVPRSWAKSATTRFFRGIGKQGKPPWSEKPGAGMLSKEYGWTTYETEWFVSLFYHGPIHKLFFHDDSPDPYGEEGHEISEEGGNRFAATRKERDDAFFESLTLILESRGLGDLPEQLVKKPKPRKPKTWKIGDKVTSRNLRDLPQGAHLRWIVFKYEIGHGRPGTTWEAEHRVYEMVFESRPRTGMILVRPVMKGKAFVEREISSSNLYRTGYLRNEVTTTYLGQWDGETIDVEIAHDGWKPTIPMRKVKMKTVRVEDDKGNFIRNDILRA